MFWKKNLKIDGCLCFGATIFSVTSSGEMYFGKKKKKRKSILLLTGFHQYKSVNIETLS